MFSDLNDLQVQFQALEYEILLANFNVQSNLIGRIKSSQKDDPELVVIMDKVGKRENFDFILMNDNTLKFKNRLCIPHVGGLREELIKGFHNSRFTVHPGGTNMYNDMQQLYWWHGLKCDIVEFIAQCLVCQQVKL